MTQQSSHKARKRFGQNFLQDHNVIYSILSNIQANSGEHWVEIGPGLGAITEPLIEKGVSLDVVELDRDLVKILEQRFGSNDNFSIHSADALKFDFSALAKDNSSLRIIGNLPYNISTPLLFHLLDSAYCIEDMHFMLQKEVVERMASQPGTSAYGRLGIMTQYYCKVQPLFLVDPSAFKPAPKVESAIVRLVPHKVLPYPVESVERLQNVVRIAFTKRRKTLRNALSGIVAPEALEDLNIEASLRPENLSLEQYCLLSNWKPE